MGISLGDIGLAAQGYDQAEMQRQSMDWGREDRDWQMEQRRAEQDKMRRDLAYQKELRDTLSQYLAGGSQAQMPMPAGTKTVQNEGLDTPDGEEPSNTPATVATPAKPAQDNMPGLYKAMGTIQAKYGKVGDFEDTRKRLKKYQEEGVLDFIEKARQGAPDDELLDTFNRAGTVKLADLKRVGDGSYVGTTADGKNVGLDVKSMTESLLSPKDLLAHQDKGEVTSERLKAEGLRQEAVTGRQQAKLDAAKDINDARAERDRAVAEAQRAKTENANTPKVTSQQLSQVRQIAKDQMTSNDALGKKTTDSAGAVQLASLASVLWQHDPSQYGSPAEAVKAAADRLEEIRQSASTDTTKEIAAVDDTAPWYKGNDSNFQERTGLPRDQYAKLKTKQKVDSAIAAIGGGTSAPSASSSSARSSAPPAANAAPPKGYPEAKQAPDGYWYVKRGDTFYRVKE